MQQERISGLGHDSSMFALQPLLFNVCTRICSAHRYCGMDKCRVLEALALLLLLHLARVSLPPVLAEWRKVCPLRIDDIHLVSCFDFEKSFIFFSSGFRRFSFFFFSLLPI